MMDLIEYINSLKGKYQITDENYNFELVSFLVENKWFGYDPKCIGETVTIDDEFVDRHGNNIDFFSVNYAKPIDEKIDILKAELSKKYPLTTRIFSDYIDETNIVSERISEDSIYYLLTFFNSYLIDEIVNLSDKEVKTLIEDALNSLSVFNCYILSIFIAYTKRNHKTSYIGDYFVEKEDLDNNDAYEIDDYCKILFHMFNKEYVDDNDMYFKACDSKNYIDTWLFISLHFICDLRNTDLTRIPHPVLPNNPEVILEQIKNDEFSKEDATNVIYSVLWHMEFTQTKPNKTKRFNVDSIKFIVPKSVEVHMGTLFAIAEAHYQINGNDGALIRSITSYKDINRYMGEEIGDLFLESNFHSRKANKSYMQIIEVLTDPILGMNEDFHVKGYMLAALARSHKGTYGAFSRTTIKYLKDQKMTGYSPEFVARELFERGVLSYIPKMLLSIITDREFDKLDIHTQTELIKELSLTPKEVENTIALTNRSLEQSKKMVQQIYQTDNKAKILTEIIHRIGNGEAISKNDGCLCLMSAIGKSCPYHEVNNCSICPYEISTKTTLLRMVHEAKRLKKEYKETDDQLIKKKVKQSVLVVARSVDEMLSCYEDMYGKEDAKIMKDLVRRINEKDQYNN